MPRMLDDGYSYKNVTMNRVYCDFLDNQNNPHLEIPSVTKLSFGEYGREEWVTSNIAGLQSTSKDLKAS